MILGFRLSFYSQNFIYQLHITIFFKKFQIEHIKTCKYHHNRILYRLAHFLFYFYLLTNFYLSTNISVVMLTNNFNEFQWAMKKELISQIRNKTGNRIRTNQICYCWVCFDAAWRDRINGNTILFLVKLAEALVGETCVFYVFLL